MKTPPDTPEATDKIAYRLSEVTALTSLSRQTVFRRIADGSLRTTKIAGRRLVHRDDLEAFLKPSREAA